MADKYVVVMFRWKADAAFEELSEEQQKGFAMGTVKGCFDTQNWEGVEVKVEEKELG